MFGSWQLFENARDLARTGDAHAMHPCIRLFFSRFCCPLNYLLRVAGGSRRARRKHSRRRSAKGGDLPRARLDIVAPAYPIATIAFVFKILYS